MIPEVSNSPPNVSQNVSQNNDSQSNEPHEAAENSNNTESEIQEPVREETQIEEEVIPEEGTNRYVLPPRATRGIPAKRYSSERISKRSQYPMDNIGSGCLSKEAKAFSASLYSEEIPANVEEALKSKKWKGAMDTEMDALVKNGTLDKSELPQGKKPVGCRWIFTIKYRPDGTIDRYKARLVAKGYTQTYGIDYSETFSPVAKIDTIRVLFSIAANQGWELHQFDVKNVFLHGDLHEEVYMEAPPGFSNDFDVGEVCRLKKALYGLKQSPRAWFGRFTLAMKKYGYNQSNSDHTLFLKHNDK